MNWHQVLTMIGGKGGVFDVACPSCGPHRNSQANRIRKVLRIWREADDFASYSCARCGLEGYAKSDGIGREYTPVPDLAPAPSSDKAELATFLWSRSMPLHGTAGEAYFAGRSVSLPECSRFLPARREHPPAIISRFGDGEVSGVHLTKIRADGSAKVGTGKDKVMIGPSNGLPLLVASAETTAIVVTEGIENACSIHDAMGWEAWAAGSLRRLPTLIANVSRGARLYVEREFETPRSGVSEVFQKITALRPDAIHLRLYLTAPGKMPSAGYDANKIHCEFGIEALRQSIIDCERAQSEAMKAEGRWHLVA